jgi:hypothetical protein
MNTKNILITGLIGAVITLLLTNIPFVNFINCLICAGFWVGPLFATWQYKRMTGSLTMKEGVWIGVTAGVIAGVIGFLLSFAGVAGATGLINQINAFSSPADQIDLGGVEGVIGNVIFSFLGVIFDIIVGIIGGVVGAAIFKNKPQAATQP